MASKQQNASNTARTARVILGILVALNLIAAGFVLYTPGGSADSLQRELADLQTQVRTAQTRLEQARRNTAAIEKGRTEGDLFLDQYFLGRRAVFAELVNELNEAARRAGMKDRGNSYSTELIDGSEVLGMLTINANYEGTYTNLLNLLRELDRTSSLLIVESLNVSPQTTGNQLSATMKINAFTQEAANPFATPVAAVEAQEEAGQ